MSFDEASLRRAVCGAIVAGLVGAAGCLATAAPAPATLPQQQGAVDLASQANVVVRGVPPLGRQSGWSVANAGDVNGDGIDDIVIGDPNGEDAVRSGMAYVVFGRPLPAVVDLSTPGDWGFLIKGECETFADCYPYPSTGYSVDGAGDVNRDGLADVIVGAPTASPNALLTGFFLSGSAYVVWGKANTETVDLANFGVPGNLEGYQINGEQGEEAGASVAGAGNVDGDGDDDVLIGAPYALEGCVYLVSGKASNSTLELSTVGRPDGYFGYRMDGDVAYGLAGRAVANAGDVNGDGVPDHIIGAPFRAASGEDFGGSAWVVFGRGHWRGTIDLESLGEGGYRIDATAESGSIGWSVANAGDVNADDRPDAIVGAPEASSGAGGATGSGFVVYGKTVPDTVSVGETAQPPGTQVGVRLDGEAAGDGFGWSVANAGDVNGSGHADVIVGAPFGGQDGSGDWGGRAYVFEGRSLTQTTSAGEADPLVAFSIEGAHWVDPSDMPVAGGGDHNGDGRADVLVGAPEAWPDGQPGGITYGVYGFGEPVVSYGHQPVVAKVGASLSIEPQIQRTGQAMFTVAPPLPGGLAVDPATGAIAGTPQAKQDAATYTVTMTDLAGETSADLPIRVVAQPRLAYEPDHLAAKVGEPVPALAPAVEDTTEEATFAAEPLLPPGLVLDTATGAIAGTPTLPQPPVAHTVTLTDLGGTASAEIVVEVEDSPLGGGQPDGEQPPDDRPPPPDGDERPGEQTGPATDPAGGPPDSVDAPEPTLRLISGSPRLRNDAVSARLACEGAVATRCKGRLVLKAKRAMDGRIRTIVIRSRRFSVRAGEVATLHLKLSRRSARILRASRSSWFEVRAMPNGLGRQAFG